MKLLSQCDFFQLYKMSPAYFSSELHLDLISRSVLTFLDLWSQNATFSLIIHSYNQQYLTYDNTQFYTGC